MIAVAKLAPSFELGMGEYICCACIQREQPKADEGSRINHCKHGFEADTFELNWRLEGVKEFCKVGITVKAVPCQDFLKSDTGARQTLCPPNLTT